MNKTAYIMLMITGITLFPIANAFAQDEGLGIAAVVNEDIISNVDVEERIKFVIGTTGLSNSQEVRQRLRPQIVRALVEERLKIKEASSNGISISESDIAQAIASIEKQHGKPAGSFEAHLKNNNLSRETFANQVSAQIAWSKMIYKKFRGRIKISDEEVALMQSRGIAGQVAELQIATILLPVDKPTSEANVKKLAEKLLSEIRAGADFSAVATQVSASRSGDDDNRFWVRPEQLDKEVAKVLTKLKPGEISPVIRTPGGYQIIKLHNTRALDVVDTTQAQVVLKQIIMRLKEDAANQEVDALMDIAKEIRKHPGTCLDKSVAGFSGLDVVDIDVTFREVQLANLSPEMKALVANLKVSDVSEPFATQEGLQLLQVCERIELPPDLAQVEKIKDMLFQQKMSLESEKYIRNLKREAFIELRT